MNIAETFSRDVPRSARDLATARQLLPRSVIGRPCVLALQKRLLHAVAVHRIQAKHLAGNERDAVFSRNDPARDEVVALRRVERAAPPLDAGRGGRVEVREHEQPVARDGERIALIWGNSERIKNVRAYFSNH